MNYVIGSGPAGVAAASTLLARGLPVTLLDAGGELESDIQSQVERLSRRRPESWEASDSESLKGPLRYNSEGAPLKLSFGSDYVYRDVDRLQPVVAEDVDAYRSLATGGLSVLWGASVLPYSEADWDGWPVTASDMGPHYVSALKLTGLAAEDDDLSRIFPLYVTPTTHLTLSSQARFMAERMTHYARDLQAQHIHFGRARLAISEPEGMVRACVYCGMCLYGCPYGLIYSSQLTLQTRLRASPAFTHRPGFIVRRLAERNGTVTIDAVSRETGKPERFEATRVYLAAGALASTAILLNSLHAYGRPVALMQSDHFLLPMLLRRWSGGASRERLHTLSQLFIEIFDRAVSQRGVHLQVYTYNDLFERMARDKLGVFYAPAAPLVRRFIDHLVLLKGYLHSDESSGIRATLTANGDRPVLHLKATPQPRSGEIIGSVTKLLTRNSRRLGASPLRPGLRKGLPGSGVHVGGSFPMRRHPKEFESDVLGRPGGFERVHVVDSTVFPTVAAPTITLTIMANAIRIACGSADDAGGP